MFRLKCVFSSPSKGKSKFKWLICLLSESLLTAFLHSNRGNVSFLVRIFFVFFLWLLFVKQYCWCILMILSDKAKFLPAVENKKD